MKVEMYKDQYNTVLRNVMEKNRFLHACMHNEMYMYDYTTLGLGLGQ